MEKETTFYRFQSEVRYFLSELLKHPIDAQPSAYLKERNFNKTKTINVMLKNGVLERHERILDSTNSEEKEAKYTVKYKVRRKDFEKKLHRIYSRYFEKNEPEKKKEIDENEENNFPIISRPTYNANRINENKNMKKIYITESQFRHIQEMINTNNASDEMLIDEDGEGGGGATSCSSVGAGTTRGDVGYDANAFNVKKDRKFWASSLKR